MEDQNRETEFPTLFGPDDTAIDEKGRLAISKTKRDWLGPNFTLVQCDLGILAIYPRPVWEQLYRRILRLKLNNRGRMIYESQILGSAHENMNCDKEGRVVIPQSLRTKLNLTGRLQLRAVGSYIQVWTEKDYDAWMENDEAFNANWQQRVQKALALIEEEERERGLV
jgi:MraZ protein